MEEAVPIVLAQTDIRDYVTSVVPHVVSHFVPTVVLDVVQAVPSMPTVPKEVAVTAVVPAVTSVDTVKME